MNLTKELKKSTLVAVWFMFLTFPLMVIRVNTVTDTVEWRWWNMAFIGVASFFLSILWRHLQEKKEKGVKKEKEAQVSILRKFFFFF